MNSRAELSISRRQLLQGSAVLVTSQCLSASLLGAAERLRLRKPLRLGLDSYAVRSMGWKAARIIDFAASLQCDSLFITNLGVFEQLSESHLAAVKAHADRLNIQLYLGIWSICPTSVRFKDTWGTADEHLALGIRVAVALGSPVVRVVLGSREDRLTPGGIDARIADLVQVLKRGRSRAVDAGVKIAVENHSGDMHSLELVRLIEEAGPDFVGANIDSGNAVVAMEDPLENLENLGRYAIVTSLRDSAAWKTDRGAMFQWIAMGDGQVDWHAYFSLFAELCPETPVNIETISGENRGIPFETEAFMKSWPHGRPKGFDRFVAFVERGSHRAEHQRPEGIDRAVADREYQRSEIERSIAYCRRLGLGVR